MEKIKYQLQYDELFCNVKEDIYSEIDNIYDAIKSMYSKNCIVIIGSDIVDLFRDISLDEVVVINIYDSIGPAMHMLNNLSHSGNGEYTVYEINFSENLAVEILRKENEHDQFCRPRNCVGTKLNELFKEKFAKMVHQCAYTEIIFNK